MSYDLYPLKKDLSREGIFFEFSGPISQSLLVEMGDVLKHKMKLELASTTTILKVFSMVVEQAQNIIHYSAEKLSQNKDACSALGSGMIVVGLEGKEYFVICGNLVANDDVPHLMQKLKAVQTMTSLELKSYYKEKRRVAPDKKSKGAGLGFIEMARKASKPIEFACEPFDDQFSFFSVNTQV